MAKANVNLEDPNGVYVKLSRGEAIGAELVIGTLGWIDNPVYALYVIFPPGEKEEHLTVLSQFESPELARSTAHTLALFKNLAYEDGWHHGQAASLDGRLEELNSTLTQAALILSGCEAVARDLESIRAEAHMRVKGKSKRAKK